MTDQGDAYHLLLQRTRQLETELNNSLAKYIEDTCFVPEVNISVYTKMGGGGKATASVRGWNR